MKYSPLALACMLIILNTPAHGAQQTSNKGPEPPLPPGPAEIILKTETGKKPAMFPHAKHQAKIGCDACHKNADFPADRRWDFKQGHALCLGCHKAKNQGAVKCDGCHK